VSISAPPTIAVTLMRSPPIYSADATGVTSARIRLNQGQI
jgi:hypothetical protein